MDKYKEYKWNVINNHSRVDTVIGSRLLKTNQSKTGGNNDTKGTIS